MNSFDVQVQVEEKIDYSRFCPGCLLLQDGQIPDEKKDCPNCVWPGDEDLDKIDENDVYSYLEESDQFLNDIEADAQVLESAGWGTDEDYGCYDECHIDDW